MKHRTPARTESALVGRACSDRAPPSAPASVPASASVGIDMDFGLGIAIDGSRQH